MWVFQCLISPTEFCGLELVDTWLFSKITWLIDWQVTWGWQVRWGSFTLTHNLTKFDDHWHCETGDAPFCEYNVITWQMIYVTRWLWSTQLKSHLAKIGSDCPSEGGDKDFLISHDNWVSRFGWWNILTLNHKGYSKSNRAQ